MAKVLGIDLGTTNSVASVVEAGEPVVVENAEGNRVTPSVVAVNPRSNERYVGQMAKRQAVTNPQNTVFSVKRLMGRKYDDSETQRAASTLPYKIVKASNGDASVEMGTQPFPPPQISAMILQKIKQDAETKLGEKISQAVITVPAYFNDAQRQATKDAGQIAGLEVLRIINEPTAAAMAYGLGKDDGDKTLAVYDLGGGTFDISILEMGDGVFEVKSTSGDTFLGGDDFDQRIMSWLIDEFRSETGIDLGQDGWPCSACGSQLRRPRWSFPASLRRRLNLPFITADSTGPKHMLKPLSRSKFQQLVADLADRTDGPCRQALRDAGLAPSQIDEVILVGGMTRAPIIQEKVKAIFGKDPQPQCQPGRSRCPRRRPPGGYPPGRCSRPAASGRYAPNPGAGDPRRCGYLVNLTQHDHPHLQERVLHHRRRQSDQRGDPRVPRRKTHGHRQQVHRPVHSRRPPPRAPGRASNRSYL